MGARAPLWAPGASVASDSEFERTGARNSPQDLSDREDPPGMNVFSVGDLGEVDHTDRHDEDSTADIHLEDAHDAPHSG